MAGVSFDEERSGSTARPTGQRGGVVTRFFIRNGLATNAKNAQYVMTFISLCAFGAAIFLLISYVL